MERKCLQRWLKKLNLVVSDPLGLLQPSLLKVVEMEIFQQNLITKVDATQHDDEVADCMQIGESGSPILISEKKKTFLGSVFQSVEWPRKTNNPGEQPFCDSSLLGLSVPITSEFEEWFKKTVKFLPYL